MPNSKLTSLLTLAGLMLFQLSPSPAWAGKAGSQSKSPSWQRAEFKILNATCVPCLRAIERGIRFTDGVDRVAIEIRRPYRALVIFDPAKTSPTKFLSKMKDDGYDYEQLKVAPEVPAKAVKARGQKAQAKGAGAPKS